MFYRLGESMVFCVYFLGRCLKWVSLGIYEHHDINMIIYGGTDIYTNWVNDGFFDTFFQYM